MVNALVISGLSKRLGTFSLENVSFTLPSGYIMGLVGPNGSGKTTTLKLILNMLKRDAGRVTVFGMDGERDEKAWKEQVGVVMDRPFYVQDWRLGDVEQALRPFYSGWDSTAYRGYLDKFRLDPKKKVKELSRGMQMKLMIACALSHGARLLLLDEPTGGLDVLVRDELMDILRDYISDGDRSVLFSTHITSDLEHAADYVTVMNRGQIVMTDTKDALLERFVMVSGGRDKLEALRAENRLVGLREHAYGFDALWDRRADARLPEGVSCERIGIDDLMIRFLKEGEQHA